MVWLVVNPLEFLDEPYKAKSKVLDEDFVILAKNGRIDGQTSGR